MKILHDKSVLDAKHIALVEKEEAARKVDVHFEQNKRQIEVPVVVLDRPMPSPFSDALKGVRV